MEDLAIENKYGYINVEFRKDGALIYFDANDVEGMPPNHIALDKYELTKLAKWIVDRINF